MGCGKSLGSCQGTCQNHKVCSGAHLQQKQALEAGDPMHTRWYQRGGFCPCICLPASFQCVVSGEGQTLLLHLSENRDAPHRGYCLLMQRPLLFLLLLDCIALVHQHCNFSPSCLPPCQKLSSLLMAAVCANPGCWLSLTALLKAQWTFALLLQKALCSQSRGKAHTLVYDVNEKITDSRHWKPQTPSNVPITHCITQFADVVGLHHAQRSSGRDEQPWSPAFLLNLKAGVTAFHPFP